MAPEYKQSSPCAPQGAVFCQEHSGQRTLLYALLALVGVAVTILIFQVGLTLSMSVSLREDLGTLKQRVSVIEYQLKQIERNQ